MTELLGVVSETSQDARSNTSPVVLTFRAWNPHVELWDDYKGALERAYAQYVDRRRAVMVDQPGHDPAPAAPDPDGSD
jgi:hypothetical protein